MQINQAGRIFVRGLIVAIGLSASGLVSAQDQSLSADERQQLLERAKELTNRTSDLYRKGSYREAKTAAEEALKIRRQVLGDDHPDTASSFNYVGTMLISTGKYAEARPYIEQGLAIRKRALGENHADTAASLRNLGSVLQSLGHYAAARANLEQSLAIRRNVLGENHPDMVNSLHNLASLHDAMGEYAAARAYYEQALTIAKNVLGENDPRVAILLSKLGLVHRSMGDYAGARPYLEQALALRKKVLGEDHPATADSLTKLGLLLHSMGDYSAARPFYEQALAINKKALGESHPETATSLNNLAALLWSMGDFAAARPYYEQAVAINKRVLGENHHDTATSLNNLAVLLQDSGDYEAARAHLEEALAIYQKVFGENHPETANSLDNLGRFLTVIRDYQAARPYLERAVAIRKKVLGESHPATATSLNNLGLLCEAQGDYAAARSSYEQALAIRKKVLGQNHPEIAHSLINLAALEAKAGNWLAASDAAEQTRRVTRRHVSRVLPGLSEKGQLLFLHQNDQGQYYSCLSLGLLRRDDPEMRAASAGWLLNGKGVAQEALAERTRLARDYTNPAASAVVRELQTVRTRLAKLSLSTPSPKNQKGFRQQLSALSQQEQDLSRKLAGLAGKDFREDPWITLAEVQKNLPAESVLIDIARFGVFDFHANGKQNRWHSARYAAWIIPPSGKGDVQLVDLGEAAAIDRQIEKLRKTLQAVQQNDSSLAKEGEPKAEAELREQFQQLADQIWKPLAPHVGQAKQLLLSPDGALWLVPWAAIPVGKNKFLIEQITINYLISGRDVITYQGTVSDIKKPVVFADPNFDLAPDDVTTAAKAVFRNTFQDESNGQRTSDRSLLPRVGRLPGTAVEAEAVKPNVEKLTGKAPIVYQDMYALESVAKALKHPKLVVFSTHGFFLPDQQAKQDEKGSQFAMAGKQTRAVPLTTAGKPFENPLLRCGLLFAGCNPRNEGQAGSGDDGVLTGMEIVGIDLRGTELVVLSACETAIGTVNNGEGVAGLRQAFQLAGAEAVVATLWQIPDADSARLMNDFCANLAAGQSKSEALRNAQLKRIEARREKYGAAHPFFWAAYTITGR